MNLFKKSVLTSRNTHIDDLRETVIFTHENSDYCFLLSSGNASLLLDKQMAHLLQTAQCPLDLKQKLFSRGFIKTSPPSINHRFPILPTFFIIDFTSDCNMACSYCLRCHSESNGEISYPQLRAILEYIILYCRKFEIGQICIQPWGGEPLLALSKILWMKEYISKENINLNITVQTNGTLITETIAKTLLENDISVGVSIDGIQKIHDKYRRQQSGAPSYERVVQGIRNLQQYYGRNFGTITVNTDSSIDCISQTLKHFVIDLGIHAVKFNIAHPNNSDFSDLMLFDPNRIIEFNRQLLETLIFLNEREYDVFDSNIRDKCINLLSNTGSEICHSHGCLGGYKLISFSREGAIYPCELIDYTPVMIGNINAPESLPEIISAAAQQNCYFSSKQSNRCTTCIWKAYCFGGCTASILSHKGNVYGVDLNECTTNLYLYEHLIELILTRRDIIRKLTNNEVVFV